MTPISSFDELSAHIKQHKLVVLYASVDNCGVCEAVLPKVMTLSKQLGLEMLLVNATRSPFMTGQLSLYGAPTIIVYAEGKEAFREGRFVDLSQLERKLMRLKDALQISENSEQSKDE